MQFDLTIEREGEILYWVKQDGHYVSAVSSSLLPLLGVNLADGHEIPITLVISDDAPQR